MHSQIRSLVVVSWLTLATVTGMPVLADTPAGGADDEGKVLAFDRRKGNCLACHAIEDGTLAGNIGPALVAMKARFPDRELLRRRLWDATEFNPRSAMPPFGRNRILSAGEIELIIDYLYSL